MSVCLPVRKHGSSRIAYLIWLKYGGALLNFFQICQRLTAQIEVKE